MTTSSDQPILLQSQAPPQALPLTPAPAPRKFSYGLRVAVLILGAGVTAYIIFQIQMIYTHPFSRLRQDSSDVAGEAGVVVLLLLMAMAAIWGVPLVAAGLFGLAAAMAFHIGNSTFYGDMSVWGGVAVILAALSAVDWMRRRGHSLDRYPALQRATSLVFRLVRLAVAVIVGITLVAILMRLFGPS